MSYSIIYQVVEVLGCDTTHGARQKEVKKNCTPKKTRALRGSSLDLRCSGSESYLFNHSISYMPDIRLIRIHT